MTTLKPGSASLRHLNDIITLFNSTRVNRIDVNYLNNSVTQTNVKRRRVDVLLHHTESATIKTRTDLLLLWATFPAASSSIRYIPRHMPI